jgi:GT2 family glycosyltransferase
MKDIKETIMQKIADVIIVCYNHLEYTKLCVNSYLEKTKDINLIIVDNNSSDDTFKWLTELSMEKNNIHVIRCQENKGWVGGVNDGIKYSLIMTKSPIIVVSNNDVVVSTGWLDGYIETLNQPEVGMVGGISNAVSGRQNVANKSNKPILSEEAQFLIGFNFAMRKEVIEQLIALDGFFLDPIFNNGASDDLDLSIRVKKMGYKLVINRQVYIHHFMSVTLQEEMKKQELDANIFYAKYNEVLVKKWGTLPFYQEINVLIGIPTLGLMDYRFWLSTVTCELSFKHSFFPIVRRLPDLARNELADMAVNMGYTHILFLDDDMAFDQTNIFVQLLSHNVDIVGVKAYTRQAPHYPCVFFKGNEETQFYKEVDFDSVGLREVDAIGASMLLVKTDVFKNMTKPYFEFRDVKIIGKGESAFGEDILFGKKAKEAGFKVWCDTDVEIAHIGDNKLVTRKSYHQAIGKG